MGGENISFAAGHLSSPIMRSSRGKLFVYFAVLGAMCFVVFLLSNAHSSLKQLESAGEKCQQQRDSLSAQLQVVYEHKNRLEKSLQQEKSDHKHTKEDIEKQLQEEESKVQQEKEKEQGLESQISQLKANYAQLEIDKSRMEATIKEQLQSLQTQKEEEIKALQAQLSELLTDRDTLEQSKNDLAQKLQKYMSDSALYKAQQEQANMHLEECHNQLEAKLENNPELAKQLAANLLVKPITRAPTPVSVVEKSNPLGRPNQKAAEVKNDLTTKNEKHPADQDNLPLLKNDTNDDADRKQLVAPFSDNKNEVKRDNLENEIPFDSNAHDTGIAPPPNNIAVERGEYVNGMDQLEKPGSKGANNLKKDDLQSDNRNYGIAADQMRDMLIKSPGDANDVVGPQNMPPIHKFNDFNHEDNEIKHRPELPVPDKHYADEDDEDQDGENEDDPVGRLPGPDGKGFPGQEFDEPEPMIPNQKEGAMVIPR